MAAPALHPIPGGRAEPSVVGNRTTLEPFGAQRRARWPSGRVFCGSDRVPTARILVNSCLEKLSGNCVGFRSLLQFMLRDAPKCATFPWGVKMTKSFRCIAPTNQIRIFLSSSLRRANHPKVKSPGFRRVANIRNSDSRSQSGSANQIVRSLRASLESHAAPAGTLGQWRPLDRWERSPPDSLRAVQGNALASVADFGRRRRMRGTEATTFDVGCSRPGCADSTDEALLSVERRKSSPTPSQTSAGDDPGVRPRVSACAVRSATHADATITSSLPERPIRGWYRTGTAAHSVRRRPRRTFSGSCLAAEVLRSPALANVKDAPTSWRIGGSAFGSVLGCFRASKPREPFQFIRFVRDYSSAEIRRPSDGNSANAHVVTAIKTVARTHLGR